ncbi:bifunctional DNA-formamidopyrimidine glycosylase/DNA-(apurinic or apyrimidinic site) lyase [Candidatus Protochlamydia phocaeensis]|uniref:bifunctional DNA-formamidopyrimidine glycosylase/DNA-(apurinic or apyrimidinic site) lyase n=1 Tax=Candidatus Protochlamydia phocaeensis TaxID=1414722 RepID=UPI000839444E|nr:bifunctional DNA-formamidopyrimidine glycosylase/DNA-(apurinic or apyrimidinic site) lyase [Candidatus Protochlamydia phocaeensis]
MPEMPEVHTILTDLEQAGLVGRKIEHADIFWPRTISTPDANTFCQHVRHQTIIGLDRRGKYLIFHLSNHLYLLAHLRMTGKLMLMPPDVPLSPYVRLQFRLDNQQELRFHDTRKFGRWYLVHHLDEVIGKIGPEPLGPDFSLEAFKRLLKGRKRALKPLLLDQSFLAGLGNIYVDEALWEAGLHPLQPANQLNAQEAKKLYDGIRHVLKRGIESRGTTLGTGRTNYYRLDGTRGQHQTLLNVFRRTGKPCPRCGHIIEKRIVAQRSTHFCPVCQPFLTR